MIWLDLCWGVPIKRDSGVFQSIQVSLVSSFLLRGKLKTCKHDQDRNAPGVFLGITQQWTGLRV